MSSTQAGRDAGGRRPRLWPGAVAVTLQWLVRFVLPLVVPGAAGTAILGGIAGGAAVITWWLFFSRVPWVERLGALALMVVAVLVTSRLVDASIANGMMGMMLPIFAIPLLSLALVAAVATGRRMPSRQRFALVAGAILLACVPLTLVRTAGVTGDAQSEIHWRWTPTAEERLLAQAEDQPGAPAGATVPPPGAASPGEPVPTPDVAAAAPPTDAAVGNASPSPPAGDLRETRARTDVTGGAVPTPAPAVFAAEWPGFRGPSRDGVLRGVRIDTDWSRTPPVEVWRRPVGPGWSSFAVAGDLVYTQEQRGEEELVSCYRLSSGEPVWKHRDAVRFWESNAGAGPRATPTVHGNRVFALGATGVLNALDARTGARLWSRDAAKETGTEMPDWGFAGSPLVVDDTVVIALAGRLVAYDAASGEKRWTGPPEGSGYSSPHLLTIGGVPQVVLLRGRRATSVSPADGTVLWEHEWQPGASILQPAMTGDGDLLLTTGDAMGGVGMRRIAVAREPAGWRTTERWTTRGLKPYFNDFVVHEGHAYGFDGSILACIDLATGERKWKGGRFGHGQLLLLPEQNALLVLSEDGELALVGARPDAFSELTARVPALNGKTWNHPVMVGNILLVRNGEEMAAFRLSGPAR